MANTIIGDTPLSQWMRQYPELQQIIDSEPVFWANPHLTRFETAQQKCRFSQHQVNEAKDRWHRFAPYLAIAFADTTAQKGVICSPLNEIPEVQKELAVRYEREIPGRIFIKRDSHLPISGSIKARGGIYEVLKHAEDLALAHNLIRPDEDYRVFGTRKFTQFFSQFSIAVGSTGNLGLSIGIMGAKLGFKVCVHMSCDAKEWKKKLLRSKGVRVVEHTADYSEAVKKGRERAMAEDKTYFIDDEQSLDLFMGYTAAGEELRAQLEEKAVPVDTDHPLFVYLPCGVGGGPGGITYGLKQAFRDNVHCFFAEPVSSPAILLGLLTQLHENISVQDFGLDNKTCADGLAVGRPSGLVGRNLNQMISGVYTIKDETLYQCLALIKDITGWNLEPSALAGITGPIWMSGAQGKAYLKANQLKENINKATHIIWATGGSMVPEDVFNADYKKGKTR